jgi:Cu+-exporting ATPase
MKKYFLSLILIVVASSMFAQNDAAKIQKTSTDSIIYTCPMHPEIISDKPGKCPKCGMDLVQKKSSSSDHKMNMMMCTMHGMVDMNHKHDEGKKEKKKLMKGMGMAMGAMMAVIATAMMIIK